MERILRIGMDVHSTNYTLCAIEPRFDGDDIIFANVKVTPEPDNIVQFIENHKKISGSGTNAMTALLQSFALTDEQIKELEEVLEKSRERGTESTDKEE